MVWLKSALNLGKPEDARVGASMRAVKGSESLERLPRSTAITQEARNNLSDVCATLSYAINYF